MANKEALILVDIQNDFLPGGALAVPDGDSIIPVVNQLIPRFDLVVATLDWHPAEHMSFAANHPGKEVGQVISWHGIEQIMWPAHCVQSTTGAQFARELNTARIAETFFKGTNPEIDSYSCFYDNAHLRETGLREYLEAHGVQTVYLAGLATDYCVKFSALDALTLGFRTVIIEDACRGVNLHPCDSELALQELARAGARILPSSLLAEERTRLAHTVPFPLRKMKQHENDIRQR